MANNKTGFDYYSNDTNRYQDMKIKRLKKGFGGLGIAIFDYILSEIYRVRGCYIEWDNDTAFDVADYFGEEESLVNDVVNCCCSVGLFDLDLLNQKNVLSSVTIQRRYLDMCGRAKRTGFKIPEEYNIITEESVKLPEVYIEYSGSLPQSKVKESKVKESKILKREETASPTPTIENTFELENPKSTKKQKGEEKEKSSDKKEKEIIARAERVFTQSELGYSDEFRQQWVTLCLMPKWRTKPEVSLQSSIRRLKDFNEDFSLLLVKSAIGGNWQGLVFTDTQGKYQDYLRKNGQNGNSSSSKSAASKEESRNRMVEKARSVLDAVTSKYGS